MTLETSPQQLQLTCKGLFTMPNSLSQVPPGSLLVADNVVVDYDGLLSGRRGIRQFGTSLQAITGSPHTNEFQEFFYKGTKLTWFGDSSVSLTNPARFYFAYDSDGLGTWVQTTHPFPAPAYSLTNKYRSAQSNDNIYFTSANGILKTDAPANALYSAGGLPGLDGQAVLVNSAGFMSPDTAVAYRMTWTFIDANHNAVQGTPSTRLVIENTFGLVTDTTSGATFAITSIVGGSEFLVNTTFGLSTGDAIMQGAATTTITSVGLAFTITSVPDSVTIDTTSAVGLSVGDTILQGANKTVIQGISGTTLTVSSTAGFASGTAYDTSVLQIMVLSTVGFVAGQTSNVQLTYTIPHGTTTAFQWQIYRTIMSASAATDPGDSEQLVAEGFPSPTDLTNGFFTVVDALPQSQLGAALYTNAGQQGISQANNIPPLANDMCFFFGYMIYGGATTQQKFILSLLSAEPPNGIQVGDTFTITNGASNFTLTGATSENISLGHFKVFTGGDPGSDILQTKLSLIHVLNRFNQTLVYAYDASDTSEAGSLPGDFFLQEQNIGGGVFEVSSSRSTCWNPALTTTPADNQSLPGGGLGQGYCSKFLQPEAVPTANTINVGNPNFEWLRCLPLRNSVIVLKADGLFQLTGTTFPFTVTTLDTGVILTAPETPTIMNNQVFAYTNQGVVSISETGPGIISRPIENLLQPISSFLYPNFPKVTFGSSYETDRKWMMSTISAADGFTKPTLQYVYDTITETWTVYKYPIAIWDLQESPTEHRLYASSADELFPLMFQERKSFTNSDFADIEIPTTITGFTGRTITVTSTTGAKVGWSLAQLTLAADNEPSIVTQISVITNILDSTHLMVQDAVTWNLAAPFTAYEQPIPIDVAFTPIMGGPVGSVGSYSPGNPGVVKFFQEIQLFFQSIQFNSLTAYFSSDFITSAVPVVLEPIQPEGGWGLSPWGPPPWGGGVSSTQSIRTYIPLSARRAHWLNVELQLSQAMSNFTLAGLVLVYRPATTRTK